MTPNKQVSPVIRISRGERDASARATHLEAATRKFLVTTNERKQMSTKTNFKRIALVAVAALGMGVLSSAPSQAAFSGTAGSTLAVTVTNGTGSLSGSASDSTTAGTIAIVGLGLSTGESYTITSAKKSWPGTTTSAATPDLHFQFKDSATSTTSVFGSIPTQATAGRVLSPGTLADTGTTVSAGAVGSTANAYVNTSWYAFQDSSSVSSITRVAGTYVYTLIITPVTVATAAQAQTVDISITIAAAAADSTVASPANSTAFIGTATTATSDTTLSGLATASDTPRGYIVVKLRNASSASTGTAARESVTVTTTIGTVGTSDVRGRSVVLKYDTSTQLNVNVYADGTAGTGTITVTTPSVTFTTKSVSFYAAAPATLVASVPTPNLKVGSNSDAIRVTAKDANGNLYTAPLYVYASTAADALIAGSNSTPVECTFDFGTDQRHECSVTGITAGTAKLKVINTATVAAATVTSNEVSVVVNANTAATVKLSFDKATYAPNERARIYVTPLDSAGKELAANNISNLLGSGGISSNAGFTFSGSTTTAESLTAVSITPAANSSSSTGARAGSMVYTVYMPSAGGTVTISATGGSSLPTAGQVAVSASATVTDSGAQALAAVTALATTVASLKTLITTLTNLVLKIQKKVKA